MDASGFGHSNNENVSPNIDRYDHDTAEPILNLLSTSHSPVHTENERTHKPLDRSCAFTLQLSNLKLSKRLDKSNSVSEPHAPLLPLQPQRRLFSQVPLRLSAPYLSASTRKPSPFPAASHVVSLHKTTDDTSDRASSPFFISHESRDNAYIHSKRQRSVSPNPQSSFRLPGSPLKRSITDKSPATAGSEHLTQATGNLHVDEALLLEQIGALLANKSQLLSQNDKLNNMHLYASQGLDECRSQLASMKLQLESANAELVKTHASFASSKEKIGILESEHRSMTAALLEAKSDLTVVSTDRERLREAHAQDQAENDHLRKRVETLKKCIDALRERCDIRDVDVTRLREAHHALRTTIDNAKKEVQETKNLADNALAAMEPLIDPNTALRRTAETKAVLKELQDDLYASQRVTDLLRDKLYNQSTLLVEARDRIRELEEEKRSLLGELLQGRKEVTHNSDLLVNVETKLEELAVKVTSRELETIDMAANSAALTTELEVLKKASEVNDVEIAALRVIKEESISKLLASQGVINAREKEIVSLKAEVKGLGESKAELRALLAESKKLLGEKEVELRAKDPNWDLEFNIKELNTQVASLKVALHTCQETLQTRETEIQRKACDVERLDTELSLSKITTTKLRGDMENFQTTASRKYEMLLDEVEQVRKHFQSQEQVLLDSNVELKVFVFRDSIDVFEFGLDLSALSKERLEVQSVALFQAKEESSKLKISLAVAQEQKTSVDVLVNLHAQHASSAEKAASLLEVRLKEAQATAVDLKSQLHQAKAELKSVQETSIISEKTNSSTLSELENVVKDLQQQNDELSRRSIDILLRYQQANLTDIERGFVAYIMNQTREIQVQDMVAKENEIRRRETMIQALQGKIVDMEITIARMIKEKENLKQVGPSAVKPVVSLNRWLPESPADAGTTHSREDGIMGENAPATAAVEVFSASAPPKNSDPKFSHFECSDDNDSEDDVPVSSDAQHVNLKRPHPSSPSVPNEQPIRSKKRTRESLAQKSIPPQVAQTSSTLVPVVNSSSSVNKVTTTATATAKKQKKRR